MTKFTVTAVALTSLVLGCAQPTATDDLSTIDEGTERLVDGTPMALGILAFLNDAETTYELLDDQVGLDRRAAESIIAHRNGPDGELGWLQDNLFETIEELDDCYYVGATAFKALERWATDHAWVALSDDDLLGTWDGVDFTVAEANATVILANTAGPNYLDIDLGLDARAVDSIIDARPIATVQELAGLYYVGKTALTTLRDTAAGEPECTVEGWETEYVYNENGAWRSQLPAEYVAVVDEVLANDAWCGEATGQPWFVKATVDRFNCEEKGYTIELGQYMAEYPDVSWYIEFEVKQDFTWFIGACEV